MLRSNLNTINDRIFQQDRNTDRRPGAARSGGVLPFPGEIRAGKGHLRHQHGVRPHGAVPDRGRRPEQPPVQHHPFAQLRRGRGAARHLRAGGDAGAGCKRSSTPKSGVHPRRGADTGRVSSNNGNLPARAAPRQRGRKRRPGAAGAYRTGADRRSGGLRSGGENRPGSRGDGGMRHNAPQASHPRRAGAHERHGRDDGHRTGEPGPGAPPAGGGR